MENIGIITSISWHSTGWNGEPTEDDLKASQYNYVKEYQTMYESINFGYDLFPSEKGGKFIAYTPKFNTLPKKVENLKIVFFISTNYSDKNKRHIVGFYGNPNIGSFDRNAKHKIFKKYDWGNVVSNIEDIIYFDNHIIIEKDEFEDLELLPQNKKLSKMGFNYIDSENIVNILGLAIENNSTNEKLIKFIQDNGFDLSNVNLIEREAEEILKKSNINTLAGIKELEKKMLEKPIIIKERLSKSIERGAIANKVKKLTGHKCLVCESLGLPPLGFIKVKGEYYIETHHVIPVSEQGSLALANLITVCANHHRQLHYGNVKLLENTIDFFKFNIDNKEIIIGKIQI